MDEKLGVLERIFAKIFYICNFGACGRFNFGIASHWMTRLILVVLLLLIPGEFV